MQTFDRCSKGKSMRDENVVIGARPTVIELPPEVYDSKGRCGHCSFAAAQRVIETYRIEDGRLIRDTRLMRDKPVYATDQPALQSLIVAYLAIIEAIHTEMRR